MCNMELFFVCVVLVSEKEVVEVDWVCLVKKVNIVFVVKVMNVEVEGLKFWDNGKMIFCWSVKNVDQLQVCFNIIVNQVVEFGVEEFLICIVNLLGEIFVVEFMGLGVFVNNVNGE